MLLIRERPVVEKVPGKAVLPGGHEPEEYIGLHVEEHCDAVASDRHLAVLHEVELAGNLIRRQFVVAGGFRGQRFVLILGEEGGFVLALQVHRVLDRGQLVVVEPFGSGDRLPVPRLAVERGRFVAIVPGPDSSAFRDRRLAQAARHRHRKQAAAQHGLLDATNDLEVILRLRPVKGARPVVEDESKNPRRAKVLIQCSCSHR